jgi:Leucine-rich repeat (LRR) protein
MMDPDVAADVPMDPENLPDTSQLPSVEEARIYANSVSRIDSRKLKQSLLVAGLTLLLLIGLIVGLTVGLTTANENKAITGEGNVNTKPPSETSLREPSGSPVQEPMSRPPTPLPQPSSPPFNARREDIHKFLYDGGISKLGPLHSSGSAQNRAVGFLATDDELQMEVPDSVKSPGAFSFLQRYVVAVFYYETGLSLLSSAPTCDWNRNFTEENGNIITIGVTCNDEDQVDSLFVPTLALHGSLPNELGELTNLTNLVVSGNPYISGSIPDSIPKLTNLVELDISKNKLNGTIPSTIGNLTKLKYLALGDNALTGEIPSSLSNLQSLTLLNLEGNTLAGDFSVLETLVNLEFLYLENNQFAHTFDNTTLKQLANLVHLDLSNNKFGGSLALHFFEIENLEVLDVTNNKMTGKLPENIPKNGDLRFLFLSGNSFVGSVPTSLQNLTSLSHLDLTANNFTGAIPNLGSLQFMVYFFCANNAFEPGPIPEFLQNMTSSLVDLSLKGTQRNGPIPTWIGSLEKLVLLDLDHNDLSGPIPSEIGLLKELEFVLLNRNQLMGAIPEDLSELQLVNLTLLLLDNNTITGSTTLACDKDSDLVVSSDCEGKQPELNCSCCKKCCSDSDPACSDGKFLAQYDPVWEQSYHRRNYSDFSK